MNMFSVSKVDGGVAVEKLPDVLAPDEAFALAAWLVVHARTQTDADFAAVLDQAARDQRKVERSEYLAREKARIDAEVAETRRFIAAATGRDVGSHALSAGDNGTIKSEGSP